MQSESTRILKVGLIGRSLAHSISPELHRALFPILSRHTRSEYGAIDYTLFEAATDADVFAWIARARREGYRGANVTYPYKELIATAVAHPSKLGRKIASANVLSFERNVYSISTDGQGFAEAMKRRVHESLAGRDLIVIGAGGAARAIVAELSSVPFNSITVFARDQRRAAAAFNWIPRVQVRILRDLARNSAPALVIQATPVGQGSSENLAANFAWRQDDIAADIVYRPIDTAFLRSARAGGARTIDGLGMLIEQAALSQLWWLSAMVAEHSPLTSSEFDSLWHQFSAQLK